MGVPSQVHRSVDRAAEARKSLPPVMFKLGANHAQLTALQLQFKVPWPSFVKGLLQASDVTANVDPQQIPLLTCILPTFISR